MDTTNNFHSKMKNLWIQMFEINQLINLNDDHLLPFSMLVTVMLEQLNKLRRSQTCSGYCSRNSNSDQKIISTENKNLEDINKYSGRSKTIMKNNEICYDQINDTPTHNQQGLYFNCSDSANNSDNLQRSINSNKNSTNVAYKPNSNFPIAISSMQGITQSAASVSNPKESTKQKAGLDIKILRHQIIATSSKSLPQLKTNKGEQNDEISSDICTMIEQTPPKTSKSGISHDYIDKSPVLGTSIKLRNLVKKKLSFKQNIDLQLPINQLPNASSCTSDIRSQSNIFNPIQCTKNDNILPMTINIGKYDSKEQVAKENEIVIERDDFDETYFDINKLNKPVGENFNLLEAPNTTAMMDPNGSILVDETFCEDFLNVDLANKTTSGEKSKVLPLERDDIRDEIDSQLTYFENSNFSIPMPTGWNSSVQTKPKNTNLQISKKLPQKLDEPICLSDDDDDFGNIVLDEDRDEKKTFKRAKMANSSYDEIPQTKNQLQHAYRRDAVRKKDDRMKLAGQDCYQCKKYFELVGDNNKENINRRKNQCSRHRDNYCRIDTPKGYWDLEFTQSDEDNG